MSPSPTHPLSLPARWVLYRARAYRRAVDARGVGAVLAGLPRRLRLVALAVVMVLGPVVMGLLDLALEHLGGWVFPALLIAAPLVSATPLARALARKLGLAEVNKSCAKRTMARVSDATGNLPVSEAAFHRLWMVEISHLLCDPQGQALIAQRDLGESLGAPGPASSAPRPRM